jgi:PAS domain S-box-containing protein
MVGSEDMSTPPQAETELQHLDKQIKTIFESITDGFLALDANWCLIYMNVAAERLLGRSSQDLTGRNFWHSFPQAVNTSFYAALDTALNAHQTVTVEEYYPPTDRWFDVHVYPSATGLSIYFHDISKRKQAAAELDRLKQHHESILNSVGEGIFGLDAHGIVTFVNPAAAAMLGYDAAELIGQRQHLLIQHTRANGTPYPPEQSPIYASIRDGTTKHVESDVFWTKHETSFPVSYISTPLRERGAIIGAVVTFQDSTERKRVEAHQATQFAVTRVMAEAETLDAAISGLLQAVCVGMDWDLGELWVADRGAHLLRRIGGWYALTVHAVDFEISSRTMIFGPGQGLPGEVWASGQPVWVTNVITDPSFVRADLAADHGLYTAFGVPVRNGREVIGVLVCFSRAMRQRDDEVLQLMTVIGSQIGQYIERRQAEAAVERSAARLATLHQIDRAILAADSPATIAEAALRHLWHFVPYQHATVAMGKDADDSIVLASHDRRNLNDAINVEQAHRTSLHPGARAVIPDLELATLHVPLIAHGVQIGALTVVGTAGDVFSEEQRAVLREVAAQLAIAIQQARLFEQIQAGNERLQALSARLLEVQEAERRHIARELHDEIGQALTAAQLNLQDVAAVSDLRELPERLEDSLVLIETLLQQVRSLSLDLRPSMLDDLGLAAALRWYVKRQAQRAGLTVHIAMDALSPRPPTDIETACYRVVQEALTNIIRYAKATDVYIDLHGGHAELQLLVRDNGIGFDVVAAQRRAAKGGSLGILGMQERAMLVGGQCVVESTPGQGTTIRARFPLDAATALEHCEERSVGNDANSRSVGG